MFVAIYRWRLHPGLEQDFVDNWQRITRLGLEAGSAGSSLFRDPDGCWVAIARWSSRAARQHFFQQMGASAADSDLPERAALAVIERFPTQELDSVLDCWAPFKAAGAASLP